MNNTKYTGLEIAIIGIACRFPGASNWREYWQNLVNGVESIQVISGKNEHPEDINEDKTLIKINSGLKDKELFDSLFFDYRPSEASLMNPMHRIFHECVWEAFEDAGYIPEQFKGAIGLYAGAGEDLPWQLYSMLKNKDHDIDYQTLNHINNKDNLTTLISYKLNLKGPSCLINTACSTSLVAVNMACNSLLMGEAKLVAAGGISINTQKQTGYYFDQGTIFSADGHCRAFDKNSSGTVGSEGAGVIILKRLSEAINDGDNIYAVIKGSAINNDGKRKVGFAAPSVDGQVDCIRKAHKFAKVLPESISYVEAHGTGTKLGDVIEVEALNTAFDNRRFPKCVLGSVKTNIGHLDKASGIAGLIKAALSLRHRSIPKTLHFNEPNSEINFKAGPFFVNTTLFNWESQNNLPLRAGVNSLGIGGTNAHVILEEAPETISSNVERKYKLLNISAKTEASLIKYLDTLKKFLIEEPCINLTDLSYTLDVGRQNFGYRSSIIYKDREELLCITSDYLKEQIVRNQETQRSPIFVCFPDGWLYENIYHDIYLSEPVFRSHMDQGFSTLLELTGEDYKAVIFPNDQGSAIISDPKYGQPLSFLFQYSLSQLLMTWGIVPKVTIGANVGEYVSACLRGLFAFDDALKLVVTGTQLLCDSTTDEIIKVYIDEKQVKSFITKELRIIKANKAGFVTFCGTKAAVRSLKARLTSNRLKYKTVNPVNERTALQGRLGMKFIQEFERIMDRRTKNASFSSYSNDPEKYNPQFWINVLLIKPKISAIMTTAVAENKNSVFVLLGPNMMLGKTQKHTRFEVDMVSFIKPREADITHLNQLTQSVGRLWSLGVNVDWMSYYNSENRKRISAPTYAFDHISYHAEVDLIAEGLLNNETKLKFENISTASQENPVLKDWVYFPSWKTSVHLPFISKCHEQSFLLFSGNTHFDNLLKDGLLERGAQVIEVKYGLNYKKESDKVYFINPSKKDHYERLLSELHDIPFTEIIYNWAISTLSTGIELSVQNKEINLVYFGLVRIAQELIKLNFLSNKTITVVTNSLHKVIGTEDILYWQSLALGIINVLPQESPAFCRNIDVDLNDDVHIVVSQVLDELSSPKANNNIIAFRCGQRWVQSYQKFDDELPPYKSIIRQGELYLIIGGLGNVGFALAEHLLQNNHAQIVLIGRSDINSDEKEDLRNRFEQLRKVSKDVHYFKADVSDFLSLKKVVKKIQTSLGIIRGVINAAGNLNKGCFELVEDITYQNTLEIFKPKVSTVENLYKVFKDKSLDFLWIASSLSSVLGGLSYASYSAANLYIDHFVSSKFKELPTWKSVCLPGLLFDKKDWEMENPLFRKALTSIELKDFFDWSLDIRYSPIVLSLEDLPERIKKLFMSKDLHRLNPEINPSINNRYDRPSLSTAFVPAKSDTQKRLLNILESFFGINNIGIEDDFFELGGDSLKAMVLLKKINKEFQINFSLYDFFELQTIGEVASSIDDLLWLKSDVIMDKNIII